MQMLLVKSQSTCLQPGDSCQPPQRPGQCHRSRATVLSAVQGADTCDGSAEHPLLCTGPGEDRGLRWDRAVPPRHNAQPCLIQKPSCCRGGLEDALGGWSPRMLCSRRMLCCQKMLSGDALLFKDALGGCSLGDALFSEDWEERAAKDALAHTGRAPWLTEVSHLASAHKHPRKVPWMEEGNLRGPRGGSDGEEDPKERFATGNRGCRQGDASFCQVSG